MGGPQREQRGQRLEERVGKVVGDAHERKGEPDDEAGRPEQQLADQSQWATRGENGVLRLVAPAQPGHPEQRQPDRTVDGQ